VGDGVLARGCAHDVELSVGKVWRYCQGKVEGLSQHKLSGCCRLYYWVFYLVLLFVVHCGFLTRSDSLD
jgi:hypothetical protein